MVTVTKRGLANPFGNEDNWGLEKHMRVHPHPPANRPITGELRGRQGVRMVFRRATQMPNRAVGQ